MEGSSILNTSFQVEAGRPLTIPSNPVNNMGRDNEHNDLIIYTQDVLFNELSNSSYLAVANVGKGTFGQVVKCWSHKSHSFVAIKIIKNQSAYYQQALMEVKILQSLDRSYDVENHNIVRLLEYFPFKSHLCLVFELLQMNLFELVKRNDYSGLTINLVQHFVKQILQTLMVLKQERVIHGDLKPENILLKDGQGHVKIIDFGSSCMEHETIYSYIQSRFYRSPEVVLYYPYDSAIDMWSLGCIAAELALGVPLFAADSERDLLTRMIEILGPPPLAMLNGSKRHGRYFKKLENGYNSQQLPASTSADSSTTRSEEMVVIGGCYQLLNETEFEQKNGEKAPTGKKYFGARKLDNIMCRLGVLLDKRTNRKDYNPLCFIDFLQGLLKIDPKERWNAHQAAGHPFVTGLPYEGPYVPPPIGDAWPISRPVGIGPPGISAERLYSATWNGQMEHARSVAHEAALMAVSQINGSMTPNSPHVMGPVHHSMTGSIPNCGYSPEMATRGPPSVGSSVRNSINVHNPILQAAFTAAKEAASNPSRSHNQQQHYQQQIQIPHQASNESTMIVGFNVLNTDSSQSTTAATPKAMTPNLSTSVGHGGGGCWSGAVHYQQSLPVQTGFGNQQQLQQSGGFSNAAGREISRRNQLLQTTQREGTEFTFCHRSSSPERALNPYFFETSTDSKTAQSFSRRKSIAAESTQGLTHQSYGQLSHDGSTIYGVQAGSQLNSYPHDSEYPNVPLCLPINPDRSSKRRQLAFQEPSMHSRSQPSSSWAHPPPFIPQQGPHFSNDMNEPWNSGRESTEFQQDGNQETVGNLEYEVNEDKEEKQQAEDDIEGFEHLRVDGSVSSHSSQSEEVHSLDIEVSSPPHLLSELG